MGGPDLHAFRPRQLHRRVLAYADSRGDAGLRELAARLGKGHGAMQEFLDYVAINVTQLYRNPERWRDLQEKVLPRLDARGPLRCWSAGCSNGAEAYTLAMVLKGARPGNHSILATDIDETALREAREGEFSEEDVAAVPPRERDRWLEQSNGRWRVCSELRLSVMFRRHDLLSSPFRTGSDLILCRNVAIYFTEEAKASLFARFAAALRPGGFLFVGNTERVAAPERIGLQSDLPFFYRRPIRRVEAWRNAS
jgi:chemotaxis protein methyltransferase CheR